MDRILNGQQAAAYMGVSGRFLRQLRERRRIPHFRVGHRTVVYRRDDLDRYIERSRVNALGEGDGSAGL